MSDRLRNIDVVVLAGGLGTRLAGVLGDTPKILAPVGGEPYAAFLLGWLARSGVRRVIFCLGHLAGKVEGWLAAHPRGDMAVETVREPAPAGTAGALRYASPKLRSDPVMVMNGDSFVEADIASFADDFVASNAHASIVCVEVPDCGRFGRVEVSEAGWIERFSEKDPTARGAGLINAGIYLFDRAFMGSQQVQHATSLEREVFAASEPGTLRCFPTKGAFHDIGTPQSLADAAAILAPYRQKAGTETAG